MSRSRLSPLSAIVGALALGVAAEHSRASCPPAGWDEASLLTLKSEGFALEESLRPALALGLLDCLADPRPALRDGIAFEALSAWMRAGQLDAANLRALKPRLLAQLQAEDPQGVARPFAALVLAELSRTDRIAPWMEASEREALVTAASDYLAAVRDYRGFEVGTGWRHGVAHGADWVLQLALNPTLDAAQLARLRDAVGAQVLAADGHAYVFNEPARLAAPLLFIARRGVFDEADWRRWLLQFPPRLGEPKVLWSDPSALAARHNLQALLLTLHFEASRSEDAGIRSLQPGVVEALQTTP
jgi:hypothetical protein